jgi:hypothetical protein
LKYVFICLLFVTSCSQKEKKSVDFELPNSLNKIVDFRALKNDELILVPGTSLNGLSYYSLYKITLKNNVIIVKYFAFQTERLYRLQLIESKKSVTKFDVFSSSFTLKNPAKNINYFESSKAQLQKLSKFNFKNFLGRNKYYVISNKGVYQLNEEFNIEFNFSSQYKFIDCKNLTELLGYITERVSLVEELKYKVLINKGKNESDIVRDAFLLYKSDSTYNTYCDDRKYKINRNTFCKPLSFDHWQVYISEGKL